MEKVNASVLKVIHSLLQHISNEEKVDFEVLKKHSDRFFGPNAVQLCKGIVKASGLPCSNQVCTNESYCKKHLFTHLQPKREERKQCTGLNCNGTLCVKDALPNLTICGIHLAKEKRKGRKQNDTQCVFYEEDDEGNVSFCGNPNIHEKWVCIRHEHLHRQYVKTYRSKNIGNYIEMKTFKDDFTPHYIIEKRLQTT